MATTTWERGRGAERPSDIPKSGLKDTLLRVKREIKDDRISMVAAAMAYYAILALVPALTAVVLIYALFSDPQEVQSHMGKLTGTLPQDMQTFLETTLTNLASSASRTLGLSAIGTILFSLWSASKGSKALIDALNIIYDEKEDRGIFRYTGLSLGLTLFGIVLLILAMVVVVGLPAFVQQFNFGALVNAGVGILSWLILLAIFSLFLSVAYRYSPNRRKAKWKWVSWGAVVASVLWAITSGLFSWYAKEFADFNKTYGSLGAAVVLMMWLYLTSYVILLGGEINAELEHQTAKDSTDGKPKPLGQRGANMADTLGESPVRHKA